MKLYCPKCQDVYTPKSSRHHHTDGAYFGTGFPHMLFMVHAEYRPKRPPNQFIPRYNDIVTFVVFFSESGKSRALNSCSYSSHTQFASSVSIPLCLSHATFLTNKTCRILTFLCTISSYFLYELSYIYIYIYIYIYTYVIKMSFQYGIIIYMTNVYVCIYIYTYLITGVHNIYCLFINIHSNL